MLIPSHITPGHHQPPQRRPDSPPPGERWRDKQPTEKMLSHFKYISFEGQEQSVHLIRDIQASCKVLGTILGIDSGTLKGLDIKHRGDMPNFCQDILDTWMMQAPDNYPVTWGGLLDALKDADLKGIAANLEKALELFYKKLNT